MLARVIETGEQMQPTRLRLIAHLLERGNSLDEDRKNAEFIVKAVNLHDQLLAACKQQHAVIDLLMAKLIELDPTFLPSKSAAWAAVIAGNAVISEAQEEWYV